MAIVHVLLKCVHHLMGLERWAQWSTALVALVADPGSAPSIDMEFATICNYSSRASNAFFTFRGSRHARGAYTYMQGNIHMHKMHTSLRYM